MATIKIKPFTLQVSETTGGDLARVLSLAQTLMRKAKVDTWADYLAGLDEADSLPQHVNEAWRGVEEDRQLLAKASGILAGLHRNPNVLASVCATCGGVVYRGPKSSSKKCPLALDCEGPLVSVKAASEPKVAKA